MTPELLGQLMPFAGARAALFAQSLTYAMQEFGIDTAQRQAAFLAQVAHESGSLKYTLELADGSAYEGRADLGNTEPGDGVRYKGRGLIQITGRANYVACSHALSISAVANPELLETPVGASRSAAWFWKLKEINPLADADKFGSVTKKINGGFNGIDERIIHWLRIRKILGL